MQLEQLQIVLRPRNRWEAIDLGLQLARRHYWSLWTRWWIGALPITLLASLLLNQYPDWISTLVWWCKPLFEPILVFWLSRAVFCQRLTWRATLNNWWSATRVRLLGDLLWRRFSPQRGFMLPLAILEGQQSSRNPQRKRILLQDGGSVWLTVIGAHIETLLALSLIVLVAALIPSELWPDWGWEEWFEGENVWLTWLSNLAFIFAMSLFAPFYIGGGFALYLARRTRLEAWDIELTFRRLADRLQSNTSRLGRSASSLLLNLGLTGLLFLSLIGAPSSHAETETLNPTPEAVAQALEEVLQDEIFGYEVSRTRWEWKSESTQEDPSELTHWDLSWLSGLLEICLWIVVGLVMAWLAQQLYLNRAQLRLPRSRARLRSASRSAQVQQASLPLLAENIPAAAQQLLDAGQYREALSLLYRASLEALAQQGLLPVNSGSTENDCLNALAKQPDSAQRQWFEALTKLWIALAYARRMPQREQLQDLLTAWHTLLGRAPSADY